MEILIKEILQQTLQRIAKKNGLSPEQYASNIVRSFLERQYKGEILDKIKLSPIEKLEIIRNNKIEDLINKKQ